jgi:ABC-type Mn2+/Zn2+ transport system ATPase subunit
LIGPQGIKLSGGQRARISLARALYSEATTIVLDDIFSALDTHVARHIVDTLNGPLGTGRTRILVTHWLELYMPKASYVVRVANGTAQATAMSTLGNQRESDLEPDKVEWQPNTHRGSSTVKKIVASETYRSEQKDPSGPKLESAVKQSPMATYLTYLTYVEALGGLS